MKKKILSNGIITGSRTIFILSVMCLLFMSGVSSKSGKLTLSKNGKTNYSIVLPDSPTAVESTAAKELKAHLDEITGADFTIVNESNANNRKPQFLVGNSRRAKALLPQVDADKLPYDGIVIKTAGKNLVLLGHPQRGTLYAVNTLLEDAAGVRWWTSTESSIPKKPTLEIPALNIEYAPQLIYREAYYRDAFDGIFASRMKCNGHMIKTTPEYGGHHRFLYFAHSFYPLIPPKKYFDEHPEWYSLVGGQRVSSSAQLCLTNDAMCEELTKNALENLRKNPDAKFISISQNDHGGACECENCKAVVEEEGNQSGALIRFVNKVAEAIEKEFPDVWVETLAYQYTRKPPKLVKTRKNVVVRLCTIECSFVQPLGAGEQNKALREDIEGWSETSEHLYIWDYITNFWSYMLPHPNLRVLAPNIRFFIDHHTIGLFEQGDSGCAAGDFVRMRNWVISHLMWNPTLDENKLFDEFMNGYYGTDAAPLLKEYWNLLLDRAEKSGVFLGCNRISASDWLDWETANKAVALMNRAIETTKDETLRNRLRREKIPIDFAMVGGNNDFRRKAEMTGTPFVELPDPQSAIDELFVRCKEFGVISHHRETGASPENFKLYEQTLRRSFGTKTSPLPDFCKDLPKSQWYQVQDFEFNTVAPNKWTFFIDDEKASNGKAVKMPGNHLEWATNYSFDTSLFDLNPSETQTTEQPKCRLYAAVRCEAKTTEGKAMTIGIYDFSERKDVMTKPIAVSEISGEDYHWVDVGTFVLKSGYLLWLAPPKRPLEEVEAVYVDRIVVVQE
jgi:hypothetical protein